MLGPFTLLRLIEYLRKNLLKDFIWSWWIAYNISNMVFHVSGVSHLEESWSQGLDKHAFEHTIILNIKRCFIDCTCQKFTKVRLSRSLYLWVMHICCVHQVWIGTLLRDGAMVLKKFEATNLLLKMVWMTLWCVLLCGECGEK